MSEELKVNRYDIKVQCVTWDEYELSVDKESDGDWCKFKDVQEAWNTRHQDDGWISVDDLLPGKCECYLVFNGEYIELLGYSGCGTFINSEDYPVHVTHWRELPSKPKAKTK